MSQFDHKHPQKLLQRSADRIIEFFFSNFERHGALMTTYFEAEGRKFEHEFNSEDASEDHVQDVQCLVVFLRLRVEL